MKAPDLFVFSAVPNIVQLLVRQLPTIVSSLSSKQHMVTLPLYFKNIRRNGCAHQKPGTSGYSPFDVGITLRIKAKTHGVDEIAPHDLETLELV